MQPAFLAPLAPGASSSLASSFAAAPRRLPISAAAPRRVAAPAMSAVPSGLDVLGPLAKEKALAKNANKIEKLKNEKCGSAMWTEGYEIADALRRGDTKWEDLNLDDIDVRMKWNGFFHRPKRTPKKFMIRIKVPNGELTSEQLRFFGKFIERYGEDGCGDITTRAAIQLRGVVLEDAAEFMRGLDAVGLTSKQSGMDNVRNMVGNPLAGVDPDEMLDTRPFMREIQKRLTNDGKGNQVYANLPRKFNISMNSTRDNFAHTHINDLGLDCAQDPATGEIGFNVVVGGFFSGQRCAMSVDFDTFISQDQVVEFCLALLRVYTEHGSRVNRTKNRFMYCVEDLGVPKLKELIAAEMGEGTVLRPRVGGPIYPADHAPHRDILGVHPQKQDGLFFVGANVPAGRLFAQDFMDMADVADEFGDGTLRVTVAEGLIYPNIPQDKLVAMQAHPMFQRFLISPGPLLRGLVSCTGAQFCNFGLADTKLTAIDLCRTLEAELDIPQTVRMHFTGCPNTCGQAQIGDIGFIGGPARVDGKAVQGYSLLMGGKIGETPSLAEQFEKGVPADLETLVPKVREILIENFGATVRGSGAAATAVAEADDGEWKSPALRFRAENKLA